MQTAKTHGNGTSTYVLVEITDLELKSFRFHISKATLGQVTEFLSISATPFEKRVQYFVGLL